MVTNRTDILTFTHATSSKDADGYPTMVESTLDLSCRPEPGSPGRRALAANGTYVDVKWQVFTDNFSDDLPRGARVVIDGFEYEVLNVYRYQKHTLIWLG